MNMLDNSMEFSSVREVMVVLWSWGNYHEG